MAITNGTNVTALEKPAVGIDTGPGWATAISALIKEEADVSALFAVKQQIQDRIIAVSEMRDLGEPTTVTDVSNYNSLWNTATA